MLKRPKEVVFEYPQPPAPYPPSQRSGAFIGPSGVGKTTTAISLLMGPYRHCYSRVYVFSPSCSLGVDPAWDAWRKHVRIEMKVPDEENYVGSMGTRHFGKSSRGIKRDMWSLWWLRILQIKVIRLCIVQQLFWRVVLFEVVILGVPVGYSLKN